MPIPLGRAAFTRAAFTLIEMLVVVAIIGILASIAMPALGSARRAALAASDLSSIRSLMQAHIAYMNFNNERFVDVGLPHGTPADPSLAFVSKLRPYFDSEFTGVRSPLDQSPHWPMEAGGDGVPVVDGAVPVWRRTSYGMNNYLSRTMSPLVALDGPAAATDTMARIKRPEAMVCFLLMAERGSYASADHPHVEEWGTAPNPAAQAASQVQINAADRRRPGADTRSNYAFLDGHAATQRFDEVFRNVTENLFDPGLN